MAKFTQSVLSPRVLVCGEPASGKTGALAQLANAGYRILLHDFDQNSRVIGSYLKPDAADIYVQSYTVAKMTNTNLFKTTKDVSQIQEALGKQAVAELKRFCQQLEHWKTDSEDLGPSSALTSKDVIVIDSGTFLGELLLLAAYEDPETKKDLRSLYQVAGRYYSAILDHLTGGKIGASVLVLTHIQQSGEKDAAGNFVGKTRDVPVGVGEKFSARKMPTYFTDIWFLEVDRAGNRSFRTAATDKASLRTSNTNTIKPVEPFDMGSMFKRLGA
jgi:hypothetical protein